MKDIICSYIREESGASAAEYAVLVAVVVGVVLIALQFYDLDNVFTLVKARVTSCVNAATGSTTC